MPVEFHCPNCGKVARGSETLIGQRVKCPGCNQPFLADPTNTQAEAGPPEPLLPLRVGDVVGPYRLTRLLGEGGMGSVFLADDTSLGRKVALKVPKATAGADGKRFRREAKAVAALDHPNICPVYAIGEHDRYLCIAMKFVAGTPLNERVGPGQLWEPAKACELVRTVARAMQHAHDQKVIHRDLKPHNIMLTADGMPVVMDFGLAKLDREDASRQTASGSVMGTPAYMPLEQARGEVGRIGHRSDIYSLGVILFELVSGRLPFTGTVLNVLTKIQADPVPPLRSVLPSADARLEAICSRAMAKEAEDRYPSMAEFATALDGYLNPPRPQVVTPPRPQVVTPARPRVVTPSREDTWVSPTTRMVFVRIPAGTFLMGSPDSDTDADDDEKPQHQVTLTKDFLLGVYPVTVGQFRVFAEATGFKHTGWQTTRFRQADDHPVVNVSWEDAVAFAKWLSGADGREYHLPTEAEWEYSCRGRHTFEGRTSKYHFGDDAAQLLRHANFGQHYRYTTPVSQFPANPFGVHDMHGNVWEWCADRRAPYSAGDARDPAGPEQGVLRVIRGGSWYGSAKDCRSADRDGNVPSYRSSLLGFRLARVLSGQ